MNYAIVIFITAIISYLLGSCNFSIIVVRLLKGKDIRKFGSGNAGLTNTLRCFGKIPALLTLAGDLLKGIVSVIICRYIAVLLEAGLGPENDVHYIGYIAGVFAIIGHVLPEERDEIQSLFERRNGLNELAKILTSDNVELYERLVKDMGETSIKFQQWWNRMGEKYQWESADNGNWEIDFSTCEIYLVTPE